MQKSKRFRIQSWKSKRRVYVYRYVYLGIHVNEYLDFSGTADTLSKAGGRALCLVISKNTEL